MATPTPPECDDFGLQWARAFLVMILVVLPATVLERVGVPIVLVAACAWLTPIVAAALPHFAARWSAWGRPFCFAGPIGAFIVFSGGRGFGFLEMIGLGLAFGLTTRPLHSITGFVARRTAGAA